MRATAEMAGSATREDALKALGEHDSDVFRARDGQRFVAVRMWFGTSAEETRAIQERVGKATAIAHPMLASVQRCEERGNGVLRIVTEYVPGPTLETWSRAGRSLPLASAVDLVRRLCGAVQSALAHGIAPLAINPRNLVVRRIDSARELSLDAKLLDLEVSASMRPELPPLVAAHFVAPEILRVLETDCMARETQDPRAHVYACGALLYHLATSALPFESADITALIDAQSCEELIAPRSLNPEMSEELERVLLRALALHPAERYSDLSELALELGCKVSSVDHVARSPASDSGVGAMWLSADEFESVTDRIPHSASELTTPAAPTAGSSARTTQPSPEPAFVVPESITQESQQENLSLETSALIRESQPSAPDGELDVASTPDDDQSAPRRRSRFRLWVGLAALGAGVVSYFAVLALTTAMSEDPDPSLRAIRLAAARVDPFDSVQRNRARAQPAPEERLDSATARREPSHAHRAASEARATSRSAAAERPKPTTPAASRAPATARTPTSLLHVAESPETQSFAWIESASTTRRAVVADTPQPTAASTRSEPTLTSRVLGLMVRGSMVKSTVARALERVLPNWNACYQPSGAAPSQRVKDTVHVDLTVDEMGRAKAARATSQTMPAVGECIARAATAKYASQAPDTGTVDVSFDLHFMR